MVCEDGQRNHQHNDSPSKSIWFQRLLPDGKCTVRLNLPVLIFMHADLIERSVGFGSKVNTRVGSGTRRREERLFDAIAVAVRSKSINNP